MLDPKCPYCYGTGAVDLDRTHCGVPTTRPCQCLRAADLTRGMEAAWRGLSRAPRLPFRSHLSGYVGSDLYITSGDDELRAHLRNVAIQMGPQWSYRVLSDADLMVAWLSPASLLGKEILDPDAAEVSSEKATLVDLVEPPGLLILRLGVKNARNGAMPEVLLETLSHRAHVDRPVWVVDQPTRRLNVGHLSYSEEVEQTLATWEHLYLTMEEEVRAVPSQPLESSLPTSRVAPARRPQLPPLEGLREAPTENGETRRVELPKAVEKKKKSPYKH